MTVIPELERELVEAAGRKRSVRRRTRRAAALGVAAAAAAALVTFWSSDEDGGPKRATGGQRPTTLSSFGFRGVRYQLSGYLGRDGGVCLQIRQAPTEPGATDDRPSVTCAGGRHLPRSLREQRVLNVGGGGGARVIVSGFTVAEVSRVKVVGTDWPARVELTRPWRPAEGVRIRAFTIVVLPPRGEKVPRGAFMRIRAVEAAG